jgi:energy-coupling factor transporter ATP-binding protein EcfA2
VWAGWYGEEWAVELRELDYLEHEDEPQEWRLVDCTFGHINLMVGANATGKTRTLNVVGGLARLVSQAEELKFGDGRYDVEFRARQRTVSYCLQYHRRKVVSERLSIDSETRLARGVDGAGELWAAEVGDTIRFRTPVNQIAVIAKRDSIQHPFLEELHEWGAGVIRYNFGTALGRDQLLLAGQSVKPEERPDVDLRQTERVVELYLAAVNQYGDQFSQQVIEDMARIGYELEAVGVEEVPGAKTAPPIPADLVGIYVKEGDRRDKTRQPEISQGMFRALSTLIQIEYALLAGAPTCILIDDIGEGLDFSRSSSLVKLLIEKTEDTGIQLIMATNDRFIMNSVPLEYWIVLERRGGQCIHHNYRNSRGLFDEFALRGLSNFDFFASGFYLRNGE